MRYAAYGSNLHPVRLRDRIPSARFLHATAAFGYELCFDKRGSDGSAKANIRPTRGGVAFVAVFEIDPLDRPALDAFEGPGYRAAELVLADGWSAFTYFAVHAGAQPLPFAWYRDLVALGAAFHRFPELYRQRVSALPGLDDPDPERRRRHEALLARMKEPQALAALSGR